MKKQDSRILRRCKEKLAKRLGRRGWGAQAEPMFRARNIGYERSERARAIECGGIGGFHLLAQKTGLVEAIDGSLPLLKCPLPYHESDHVLNIAYNPLSGGTCLDDIELRRQEERYMDALGAERIPDPTTAGDFTRRFLAHDVVALMEAVNGIRPKRWRRQLSRAERWRAIVDVDGTVAPTTGACQEGMGMAYTGVWGYPPLVVSLANTREPLYLVNRSGDRPSHEGSVEWLDRAARWAEQGFDRVGFRGDTDFALTGEFDRWTGEGREFVFGTNALGNLVERAEGLEEGDWRELTRGERTRRGGEQRARPANVKERIVAERGYRTLTLETEDVAEFGYRPGKCGRAYRMIVLRKRLRVKEGQKRLFPETRYFFYITNREDLKAGEVVSFANERCEQENLIDQLKNGLNALRMPGGDLVSNWAYMVMASLAWTLKAWFALLVREGEKRRGLLRMEFRRFLNAGVRVPCQIVRGGRRILYRVMGYTEWTGGFLRTFDVIRSFRFA